MFQKHCWDVCYVQEMLCSDANVSKTLCSSSYGFYCGVVFVTSLNVKSACFLSVINGHD